MGYHGMNCSDMCKFPSYGEDCQNTCNCGVNYCDHKIGCNPNVSRKLEVSVKDTMYLIEIWVGVVFLSNYLCLSLVDAPGNHPASWPQSKPDRLAMTTPSLTKNNYSEKPPITPNLLLTIMYIAIAFVGIIVILCCLFVGIYFYKHCMKKVVVVERKDHDSAPGGYSILGVESQRQVEHLRELTYLEPVSGHNVHYNEIKEQDEIRESFDNNLSAPNETKNIASSDAYPILPHSESFPFPSVVYVHCNTGVNTKKKLFATNSL